MLFCLILALILVRGSARKVRRGRRGVLPGKGSLGRKVPDVIDYEGELCVGVGPIAGNNKLPVAGGLPGDVLAGLVAYDVLVLDH